MLVFDFHTIGNKLLIFRKRLGLTQAEIAEVAGLSERAYADIERGTVNMRIETFLHICEALHITPDEVLTEKSSSSIQQHVFFKRNSNRLLIRATCFCFFAFKSKCRRSGRSHAG